jgi:hypothetical protein
MTRLSPVLVPHVLRLLLVGVACQSAFAVLMPSGSNDQDYKDLGATFVTERKVLSLKQILNDGSGVGYASATPINSHYVITSAHLIDSLVDTAHFEVGIGSNFRSPVTSIAVSEINVYPGYVNGSRNGPDIAILKLATPLPNVQPATIGSASIGTVVSAAGYGVAHRVGESPPATRDGFIRGWNAEVQSGSPQNSSDVYYDHTYGFYTRINLGGKVLNGDSGGPVYNQVGQLVGLNTAQTGNQLEGRNIYLVLSQPDVLAWIQANTVIPTVVAPTIASFTCTAPSSGQPPQFTGTLTGGHPSGTARLEASRDLGVGDPWTELANTPLDAAGSATFTNVPDTRPESANTPRLFYRIVSVPAP